MALYIDISEEISDYDRNKKLRNESFRTSKYLCRLLKWSFLGFISAIFSLSKHVSEVVIMLMLQWRTVTVI